MRLALTVASLALLAACAAPAIENDLSAGDVPLPERGTGTDRDAGGSTIGDKDTGAPPAKSTFALSVTLSGSGAGTITSTPAGVTCTGTTCKGTFAKGTSVSLALAPTTGSVFTGWSGKCMGMAPCAAVVDADVTVGAALESLDGAWSGTYTNTRMAAGCTFNNNGNLTATVTATAADFASAETMTGFELRTQGCGLVSTENGSAPSAALTVSGTKITGTWNVTVQNTGGGTLPFPFTATLGPKKITGTWTCATCTGGFTLTKP